MSTKSTALTWLAIAAAGIGLYYLYKKQIAGAVTTVGQTIASPFEALYTSVTGLSPTPAVNANVTPTNPLCYQTDPATGALTYDASGTLITVPCGVGRTGTTPGTATQSNYGS